MRKITIVADDKIPFLKGVFEPYGVEMRYISGGKISRQDLLDAQGLITRTRTCCNRELLAGTAIKYIATATIGFDHIDTDYLAQNGILWSNAAGCNAHSVMQYITSILTKLPFEGKTLGIIGVGNVGSKVAKVAQLLGMNLLLNDPPRAQKEGQGEFVKLSEVVAKSDIITIHAPLNSETFHLVDHEFLSQMKPSAWLINSARGEITSNVALKEALKSGRIAGAILDVWEEEPNIDLELLNLVKFATPHIAGYSTDGKANGTMQSVRSIAQYFDIEPLKNFVVESLPMVVDPIIEVDKLNLAEIIAKSYDIANDDSALRANPQNFEKLRGEYPLRREFSAFKFHGNSKLKNIAQELASI